MADQLTKEQIDELKEAFSLFDKTLNGKIKIKDISSAMQFINQNITEQEVFDMIRDLSTDGDESIDFFEFLSIAARIINDKIEENEIIEALKVFDRDGTGILSTAELKHIMTCSCNSMTDEEFYEMVRDADIDGNGHIDYKKLVKIMKE